MNPNLPSVFHLPDNLSAKADPKLIADDERHFAAIAASLERSVAELSDRLDEARRAPGGTGQAALDRDQEIHRLTARLRTLRRYGLDLCLGRIVGDDGSEPVYIGRLGLTDDGGRRLLLDWRAPAAEPWAERLERIGLDRIRLASLSVNYRTPEEVMAAAEPVIRTALPDANVPTSVRSTGVPVEYGSTSDLDRILGSWLSESEEGTACVIGDAAYEGTDRVRSLPPEPAKGLEFDLVVLVDPDSFGGGVAGAVDRCVAMTRATRRLVVLTGAEGAR